MTKPRIFKDVSAFPVKYLFNGTLAVEKGDLLFHDTDDVKPASSQADAGTAALNKSTFAPLFAGVATETRTVLETAADPYFPVATDIIAEYDCVSATFEIGDKVSVTEVSTGDAVENQKLEKTTVESVAIGVVVKRYSSATTRVLVRLISKVTPNAVGSGDTTSEFVTVTTPVLIFDGATGANEIRVPTNLADALSIEDSTGDILTIDTTTGTVVLAFGAAVRVNVAGDAQIGSATTDLVAFHGSTPTDQCAAYVQTFSTADRTHAARTAVDLTDNSAGTPADTIAALADGTTYANDVAAIRSNFASLARTCDRLIVDLANTASFVNSIADDLQEKGLVG
jgi:hypothetical protein